MNIKSSFLSALSAFGFTAAIIVAMSNSGCAATVAPAAAPEPERTPAWVLAHIEREVYGALARGENPAPNIKGRCASGNPLCQQ